MSESEQDLFSCPELRDGMFFILIFKDPTPPPAPQQDARMHMLLTSGLFAINTDGVLASLPVCLWLHLRVCSIL